MIHDDQPTLQAGLLFRILHKAINCSDKIVLIYCGRGDRIVLVFTAIAQIPQLFGILFQLIGDRHSQTRQFLDKL